MDCPKRRARLSGPRLPSGCQSGAAAEAKTVGEHSFKLSVGARVLELGHGAWRHEMEMGDGDGERVLPRVQGPLSAAGLSAAYPPRLGPMRPAASAFFSPPARVWRRVSSTTARTGQSRDLRPVIEAILPAVATNAPAMARRWGLYIYIRRYLLLHIEDAVPR